MWGPWIAPKRSNTRFHRFCSVNKEIYYSSFHVPHLLLSKIIRETSTSALASCLLPLGCLPRGFLPLRLPPLGFLPLGLLPLGFLPLGLLPPSGRRSLSRGSLSRGSLSRGSLSRGSLSRGLPSRWPSRRDSLNQFGLGRLPLGTAACVCVCL